MKNEYVCLKKTSNQVFFFTQLKGKRIKMITLGVTFLTMFLRSGIWEKIE